MSAARGLRGTRRAALALALAVGAPGLAGCEYADDVGLDAAAASPTARTSPPRAPLPTQEPELVATEARNMAELDRILGTGPEDVLMRGAGGIGGSGFRNSLRSAEKGTHAVSVACVGTPNALLFVSQDTRPGGGSLQLSLDCGALVETALELEAGRVWVQLVRNSSEPGTGAVAGFRISPGGPGGPAP
ncbi:hypothetical protein [Arthrobacter sp. UYCu712]|uniref:hypothetical protein n=1 Tax=Arthrobacter sp. UYCu712 TaxID=3156340 RepID=UPI003396752C